MLSSYSRNIPFQSPALEDVDHKVVMERDEKIKLDITLEILINEKLVVACVLSIINRP